jgi:hypothetical protein
VTIALAEIIAEERRKLDLRIAQAEQREIELTKAERWAADPIACLNSGGIRIASKFNELEPARMVTLELYPHQVELLSDWIDLDALTPGMPVRFRNVAAEKSRQDGYTVAFAAAIWWALHFHQVSLGAIHQELGDIDDGGPRSTWKSLFGKVRYIERHYDRGMIGELEPLIFRTHPSKIESPATAAVIYGEGRVDDPFRGMTLDGILVDEAAFVQHGEAVFAAIGEACPQGKALISTVQGDDTIHARIIDSRPKGWRIRRDHWTKHPIYSKGLHVAGEDPDCRLCEGNRQGVAWSAEDPQCHRFPGKPTSPWYDEAVLDKTNAQVARELDIDRAGALTARVYPEFSTETHVVAELSPPMLDGSRLELAWDFGTDVTAVVICEDLPRAFCIHGCVELGQDFGTSATASLVAAAIRDFCVEKLGLRREVLTPQRTRQWHSVGDPSGGHSQTPNALPEFEEYRKVGFDIVAPPHRMTARAETNIRALQRLLLGYPKPLLLSEATAPNLISHFRNNVWPTDSQGQRRIGATTPEDNIHNHSLRALAYLVVSKFPPPDERSQAPALPPGHDPGEMIEGGLRYGMPL